jgi:Bacterial regulatory protein, Fis family
MLTKQDAARLLGISVRTLQRRMSDGTVKFTKLGTGPFATVTFTHTDLGLPEPEPATEPTPTPEPPEPAPAPEPQPMSAADQRLYDDLLFAERYRRGEVPDSLGNFVDGRNKHFQSAGATSLLGPQPPRVRVRPDTCSHMDARLLGTHTTQVGTDGAPVACANADNAPLLQGFKGLETPKKLAHPNQTRQQALNAILSDVRQGWSR